MSVLECGPAGGSACTLAACGSPDRLLVYELHQEWLEPALLQASQPLPAEFNGPSGRGISLRENDGLFRIAEDIHGCSHVAALTWHPSSERDRFCICAATSAYNQLHVYNFTTSVGKESTSIKSNVDVSNRILNSCCFINERNVAVVGESSVVEIVDLVAESSTTITSLTSPGMSVRFDDEARDVLLVGELSGSIRLVDIRDRATLSSIRSDATDINLRDRSLHLNPSPLRDADFRFPIIAAASSSSWCLWDVRHSRKAVQTHPVRSAPNSKLEGIRLSRTVNHTIAIAHGRMLRLVDSRLTDQQQQLQMNHHSQTSYSAHFKHRPPAGASSGSVQPMMKKVSSGTCSISSLSWLNVEFSPVCIAVADRQMFAAALL